MGQSESLQRLLTHSFSGKALAVRRVTENQGKNTPGVDKMTWNTPQKKLERDLLVAATGLPSTTASTHLHPEEKRQKASFRYSRDEV